MSQPEFSPFVSVIIPTYMRAAGTERAIQSALDQTYPPELYEVIVVDGSSTDGTAEMVNRLQDRFPGRIVFITRPAMGPSASRNAGAAQARGEIFAFLDSDCVATPDWLRSGVATFTGRPQLGMVQGKTLPPPGVPLGARARFVQVEQENCIHDGCNMFYRRTAFESVSGFSREFYFDCQPRTNNWILRKLPWAEYYLLVVRYSGEDTDLGWRVLGRNWQKDFCAAALIYHEVRILSLVRWLLDEGCYAFGTPRLARKFPQIRRHLYGAYFLNPAQALVSLLIAAVFLAVLLHPAAVILFAPYIYHRVTEPTRFWRGLKRPFRFLVHLPRDVATFILLLASSIRHRRLVV